MSSSQGVIYTLVAISPDGHETVAFQSPDDIKVYEALRNQEAWKRVLRGSTRYEVRSAIR